MSNELPPSVPPPPSRRWRGLLVYGIFVVVGVVLTVGILALLFNIMNRKVEGESRFFPVAPLDERTIAPAVWGRNFPFQYDTYQRTADTVRTKHGGSEAINKLEQYPFLKRMYAGYAFALDFREERGHAYMFADQVETERVKLRKQPGACLHRHSQAQAMHRKAQWRVDFVLSENSLGFHAA